jgi:hypothetical protein
LSPPTPPTHDLRRSLRDVSVLNFLLVMLWNVHLSTERKTAATSSDDTKVGSNC